MIPAKNDKERNAIRKHIEKRDLSGVGVGTSSARGTLKLN